LINHTQRNARYKQENNADRRLLEELIPKYDSRLLPNMILECKAVIEDAKRLGLVSQDDRYPQIRDWTISGAHDEPAYYTTRFSSTIQYIPSAFAPLHIRFRYTLHNDVEYVPCYIMNANRVALAKFHRSGSQPKMYDEIGTGRLYNLVLDKGIRMRLSSTNILLPGEAQERALGAGHNVAKACFEHCWWRLPTTESNERQSTTHDMIYHTWESVKGVIKLHKTLLRVTQISRSDSRSLLPHGRPIECVRADVVMLVYDGGTIRSEKRHVLISKRVVGLDLENKIVSATIAIWDKRPKTSIVVGVTEYEVGNLLPILSLSMWDTMRRAREGDSLTKVGNIDEIADIASGIIEANNGGLDVFHPGFMWRIDRGGIRERIRDLFPVYALEAGTIYHLPPAVIAFLLTSAPDLLRVHDSITAIARMFDLVSPNVKKWGMAARDSLRIPPRNMESSPPIEQLLAHVPSIAGEASMSRVLAGVN